MENYNKLLKKAKEAYSKCVTDAEKRRLEAIFPELKEVSDEKIRKEILDYFKDLDEHGYPTKEWIAWIGKQDEQKLAWSDEDEYQINTILHSLNLKKEIYKKRGNKVEEDRYNTQYNWLKSFETRYKEVVKCDKTLLENQNKDDKVIFPKFTFDDVLALECCIKEVEKKDEKLYNQLQNLHNRVHDAYWLDREGEKKETLYDKCRREQPYHSCQDITELGRCALEHQCEQKSNNVESKFKVGDWIVQNGVGTYKIVEVCESWYEVVDAEDNQYSISFDKEYMCHLWTIQDAKDGDVLTFVKNGTIFIFKNVLDNMPYSYCGIDYFARFRNCIEEGGKDGRNWTSSLQGICPATKKQRDILFQKMKEAEYEWDAENKLIRRLSKFHVGDKLISSKNPRLTYNILEVGHINELGNTEYKVEIFTDGKAQNPCNILYMECYKVDEWAELINQKSNDKVEPKFKAGDLVVDNCGYIWKIEGILNQFYLLEGVEGGESRPPIELVNKNFHLWAIQDAKDGDVVVDKSNGIIGIFQSIGHHIDGGSYNDPSYCFLHCRYDDGFFYADFENGNMIDADDLIPAIKEQRDILFAKMAEAGYEWDPKNKSLGKQCNQEPINKVIPKFKVGDKVLWKYNKSVVRTVKEVSKYGTYWIECQDCSSGWWSEQDLEPYDNQDKQEPTIGINPKFHKGQWIFCKGFHPALIVNIVNDKYEIEFTDNGAKGFRPITLIDKHFRPWTIKDAKEGDVLALDDSKCLALFKNIYDKESFCSYGLVDYWTEVFENRASLHDIEGAHPATKKQYDLFFQKMKEAGYEWDLEKKELNKI